MVDDEKEKRLDTCDPSDVAYFDQEMATLRDRAAELRMRVAVLVKRQNGDKRKAYELLKPVIVEMIEEDSIDSAARLLAMLLVQFAESDPELPDPAA